MASHRIAKVASNLSKRTDLMRSARTQSLSRSAVLEAALEQAVEARQRAAWLEENQDAIDRYNARVERHGVFSNGWRRF